MLCYKDRTFCEAKCSNTECSRLLTHELEVEADNFGLPLAVSDFSNDCKEFKKKEYDNG